ncbi:MAG TPA: aminotransferase class I/II-fold pyridoxal phosphate-dependent enzyme [Candidatus Poseidonia sp.]|nr:aminotransferase class I/II-fold pyridoxal phosphate-dependent enzyme [Poseidonia sp.]|tara:strand:+ start:19974 stop:21269 length:1296 start_codon:yes stop_codon:yes gene_type:complete
MDEADAMQYLASHGHEKTGNDVIFSWFARYQNAAAAGADAVNGTVGALLEDGGSLAINTVVDEAIRVAPASEFAAYAPLKGLPSFLDLAVTLALGEHRGALEGLGLHTGATATPGGSGALFQAASNFAERGDAVLLRDRHWGPYVGFLKGCGLRIATYPLLPSESSSMTPFLDLDGFRTNLDGLVQTQDSVMTWLNDPAHNPTGLSLPPESRYALLNAFMESATRNEHTGHTLLLDAAYHLYADEPHGWAETIAEALNAGLPWPENLLICFAISLSKSHTIYGLRTGAVVYVHPEASNIQRLNDVMGVTGRQTWSASPRIAQHVLSELHATEEGGAAWSSERDRLANLLTARRKTFIEACQRKGVAVNPSHDGFFAWYECKDPGAIAEACANQHVYLVPLSGGVRIGLCAIPESQVERVAEALAKAAEAVE